MWFIIQKYLGRLALGKLVKIILKAALKSYVAHTKWTVDDAALDLINHYLDDGSASDLELKSLELIGAVALDYETLRRSRD